MLVALKSSHFVDASHVASYLGVVPIENQAGSPNMRKKLYMSALTAIRFNAHMKSQYERLLMKGKSKVCALGAAMRKLVHICYGVLKTQQKYDVSYGLAC